MARYLVIPVLLLGLIPSDALGDNTIKMTWDALPGAGAYVARYKIQGGDWIEGETGTNEIEFYDAVPPGAVVRGQVKGCYSHGTSCQEGTWSDEVAVTHLPPLGKPINVQIRTFINRVIDGVKDLLGID